jgi:lysophospholipase L1-like esterase
MWRCSRHSTRLLILLFSTLSFLYGAIAGRQEWFPIPQLLAVKHRLFPLLPPVPYADYYTDKVRFWQSRPRRSPLVLLGDSHIEWGEWVELLGRSDVLNRGIRGDTTLGVLVRLPEIYASQPAIAVLMVGTNDLDAGYTSEEVARTYQQIVEGLLQHGIRPVIHAVLFRNTPPSDVEVNAKTAALNAGLEHLCRERGLPWLDLNHRLAPDGRLDTRFTWDGVHLTVDGYAVWAQELTRLLATMALS